jgi:hypothetical protein
MFGPVFDGKTYGPLGFTREDGEGVCYSFYQIEQRLKNLHYSSTSSGSSRQRRKIKSYLIYRDGLHCKYCNKPMERKQATVDHFVPVKMWQSWLAVDGDNDTIANLVLACQRCNLIKGNKSPVGFEIRPAPTNWRLKMYIRLRRYVTKVWLVLNGTRTITGDHKGHSRYLAKHGIVHVHRGAEHEKDIII